MPVSASSSTLLLLLSRALNSTNTVRLDLVRLGYFNRNRKTKSLMKKERNSIKLLKIIISIVAHSNYARSENVFIVSEHRI